MSVATQAGCVTKSRRVLSALCFASSETVQVDPLGNLICVI